MKRSEGYKEKLYQRVCKILAALYKIDNKKEQRKMERLAVIGCGTMGPSIALTAALAGLSVKLYGINKADIRRGINEINSKLMTLRNKAVDTALDKKGVIKRITTTSSLSDVISGTTFIIEAIPEDLELKKKLMGIISNLCGKGVIIASNTSGLSPSFLASSVFIPNRFIVTHFWNPAHLIPLVEVIPSEKTNKITVQRTLTLLNVLNKKAIVLKKEIPGFIANRLQFALFREALYLLEKGIASKEDIDAAVVYSFGRRLCITGPFTSADMGGLDIYENISDYLFGSLSNAKKSLPTLKRLVAKKQLGSKTGTGFYKWTPSFNQEMSAKRENELIRFLKEDLLAGYGSNVTNYKNKKNEFEKTARDYPCYSNTAAF